MPRRAKPIAIDLTDLANALEDHSGVSWYLDVKSGKLLPVSDDMDDDVLPVPRDELDESARFIFVEPIESRAGWEDMRDFIEMVTDRRVRELLEVAIAGKGAFGRFRDVLRDAPGERARWLEEHDRRMQDRARAWLEAHDIVWTARSSPVTAPETTAHPPSDAKREPEPVTREREFATDERCQICARRDLGDLWIEVCPEGKGISCVTVDVTMRLCPDHRRRLLEALGRADGAQIEPPRHGPL